MTSAALKIKNDNFNSAETVTVPILQMDHAKGLPLPSYATEQAACMDIVAAVDAPITLNGGDYFAVPTGICMAIPPGFELQVRARSGLAAKNGVGLVNGIGTIDSDYRGEIKVILINHGKQPFVIERGMRIAQILIARLTPFAWESSSTLDDTARGSGGFGSTGTK